jgi:hypothetical protein
MRMCQHESRRTVLGSRVDGRSHGSWDEEKVVDAQPDARRATGPGPPLSRSRIGRNHTQPSRVSSNSESMSQENLCIRSLSYTHYKMAQRLHSPSLPSCTSSSNPSSPSPPIPPLMTDWPSRRIASSACPSSTSRAATSALRSRTLPKHSAYTCCRFLCEDSRSSHGPCVRGTRTSCRRSPIEDISSSRIRREKYTDDLQDLLEPLAKLCTAR